MEKQEWLDILLGNTPPAQTWNSIASALENLSANAENEMQLEREITFPDRILAEAAYPLWDSFFENAPKTSTRLIRECTHSPIGKAVLILDALSLREASLLLRKARERAGLNSFGVTFSEAPSTTTAFAKALGANSRSELQDDGKTASFKLFGANCTTDSYATPFTDGYVPTSPNIVIWHSFIDDIIHHTHTPADLATSVRNGLSSDAFWNYLDKLRQGRSLIITSDHGYAVADQFPSEITNPDAIQVLRENFGAKRCAAIPPPQQKFMPPIFVEKNGHCIVTGQRKWRIRGGFPTFCHGGLSLLEVASPFIIMPPLL